MKNLISIVLGIFVLTLVSANFKNSANETGVQFQTGSWSEVQALAKKENKPIFLYIHASWCGYCKKMKAKELIKPELGAVYNSKYINYSVDGEVGDGIALAKKYNVKGYPTMVYINPDGSMIKQTSGYKNAKQLLELAK